MTEKNDSLSVFLHVTLPKPATLFPAFFTPIFLETSYSFSCISKHSSSLIDWHSARHNPTQFTSIKSGPHFGIFDLFTKSFCDSCSFGRRVNTSSPSITFAFLHNSPLKLGSTIWCTSLNCMVTNAFALSTFLGDGRSLPLRACFTFYQIRDRFQGSDHTVTLSAWRSVRQKNHFAVSPVCKVSRRVGFLQSYGCPQALHHHPLMLFFFRFSPW